MAFDSREVRLAAHVPTGLPVTPGVFRLTRSPVSGPVVVRNRWMAVTAAMRTLISGSAGPMPPYQVGEVMYGPAVGEVVASTDPDLAPGDWVRHGLGWREHAAVDAYRRIDPVSCAEEAMRHLGQGLTTYVGLRAAAEVRHGDTVLVTGAAGAVGGIAAPIARLLGAARVVGGTGSPGRAGHLGYDALYDRHTGGPADVAPDGVDAVLDTVGGHQLREAVELARPGARIALCGALAHQLGGDPAAVELDLMTLIGKRVTLRGFTAADHPDLHEEWYKLGLREPYTEIDGLDDAPRALIDLLAGRYVGGLVVRV
ncbi:zinc-binding dehydrogenase [Sphaerisporangium aureirubrum]|uniref:Zinc-binding dehydrogenase n=1 Tax=Sphaerisporangium aureirubrum TaxID=1544736 RepID=A0ABW1NMZ9_9ACTN